MQRKLKLDLDELQVETFHTAVGDGQEPGTVFGQGCDTSLDSCSTCIGGVCNTGVVGQCGSTDGSTCTYTCGHQYPTDPCNQCTM